METLIIVLVGAVALYFVWKVVLKPLLKIVLVVAIIAGIYFLITDGLPDFVSDILAQVSLPLTYSAG
ncbi:MAG: hypothetical protein CMK06_11440 [Ponticaulis sp.]|nr:hypothetical protein [Ponticaulis sp.]|tara:strand:+ start:5457 stop:5657 length:201 start_codon:yes stop_codon:yes gene_type:complete